MLKLKNRPILRLTAGIKPYEKWAINVTGTS